MSSAADTNGGSASAAQALTRTSRTAEWMLRLLALCIVVAGIVDPVFTRARPLPPVIAWREVPALAGTPGNATANRESERFRLTPVDAQRADLLQQLSRVGTVVHGAVPDAQATVLWGSRIPADLLAGGTPPRTGPVFIVPGSTARGLVPEALYLPRRLHHSERATVQLRLARDAQGDGGPVTVELRVNGVLRHQHQDSVAPGMRRMVSLPVVADTGLMQDIVLRIVDGEDSLQLRQTLSVDAAPWRVLFLDARPSWLSTFVRRALEQDTRFAVSTRTVTSTNVTVATPQTASGLEALIDAARNDASALPDLLVVGAPERLTTRDVQHLRSLAAAWGRSVLVLPDHVPADTGTASASATRARQALDSLLGHAGWERIPATSAALAATAHPRAALDSTYLPGRDFATPRRLQDDVLPLLAWNGQPVAWMRAIGDGVLASSGALDSWQSRDPQRSTFAATWRQIAARLAASGAPRLRVQRLNTEGVDSVGAYFAFAVSAGGSDSLARVHILGDDSLPPRMWLTRPVSVDAAGGRETASGAMSISPLSVYASDRPQTWLAQGRFPSPGLWTLMVARGRDTLRLALPVDSATRRLNEPPVNAPEELPPRELLEAWARATGGQLLLPSRVSELPTLVRSLVQTPSTLPTRPAPWRPMRSGWWILPLTLALGGEWWLRRRRGAR
ncbi:MAG: hypothetical protein K2Y26_18160 [Gemmatimonadaceae bacterium]|nr:hypothetical protein [Gemmatimonadaceae bacterium]